uniref:Dihydrolipoamide acetyltransferase component of pyruvate dehydrogenase complex n=1 Tax=Paulinella chromatophora TaxID=39717 RepID=B1X5B8_PAUCH|nr:dihydrolipoamide acetyltransferase [Paulinella chromatophora]ACB43137.1 dihydrolipoamide acetyltransferase [Paulinella chromatophora]
MAIHDIFMPTLSSTMTEGKIVEWLKKPGDKIARGESLLVVESDKADMDVEAFQEGFLAAILVSAGNTTPVGEVIGLIVESEAEILDIQSKIPQKSNLILELKDSTKLTSPNNPKVTSMSSTYQTDLSNPLQGIISNRILASPRAKKLGIQLGVNLAGLKGSGPNNRIQAEDVQKAASQEVNIPRVMKTFELEVSLDNKSEVTSSSLLNKSYIGKTFGQPGEIVPLSTLQEAVNRNMMASLNIPCFRVSYKVVTDKLDKLYKKLKIKGVTMTSLLAKAVGLTLIQHPQLNATIVEKNMTYPSSINIAVAVAMDDGGLVTPVLLDVDKTDLYTLSRNWNDLVNRARRKQLHVNEYSTGTFTISNLGMFGVDSFDAILPTGTGAILAIGVSRSSIVITKDDAISIKCQMKINLTCDHRVIYGTHAAAFLKDLSDLIENRPDSLLL